MATGTGPATVFVVDDDAGLIRLIERALRRDGYVTATASSASEAIHYLTRHRPDLLLLDLKLQGIEGGEVISQLDALDRKVPFVIITGQGDERVAVEMMKRGSLDYLVKDVNFIEFLPTVVRRALAHVDHGKRLAAAEELARQSQALTQAVLNSLTAQIAVLDPDGNILAVNQPWEQFAQDGRGPSFSQAGVGANYLQICRQAATRSEHGAGQLAAAIEAVLKHSLEDQSVEYPGHSADGERWFLMTVTPLAGTAGGAVIAHIDITERKRLESEVLHIAEAERQRVAADLHDGICQELTGIGFTAAALQRELNRAGNPLTERIEKLERAITDAVGHTRQVARGLNAVVADGHGLMHALEQLTITTAELHRIRCSFECRKAVPIENPIAANELYRIAQEALTNAVRHGRAKRIRIKLSEDANGILLVVADDGKGMPAELSGISGMGLRVMKYRAGLMRGQLAIQPRKHGGTEVICRVPKSQQSK